MLHAMGCATFDHNDVCMAPLSVTLSILLFSLPLSSFCRVDLPLPGDPSSRVIVPCKQQAHQQVKDEQPAPCGAGGNCKSIRHLTVLIHQPFTKLHVAYYKQFAGCTANAYWLEHSLDTTQDV